MNLIDVIRLVTEMETSKKLCAYLTVSTEIEMQASKKAIKRSHQILALV